MSLNDVDALTLDVKMIAIHLNKQNIIALNWLARNYEIKSLVSTHPQQRRLIAQ